MKKLKKFLVLVLILPCLFMFTACKGQSAYQIAVKNGFNGTEREWLESLKGDEGQNADVLWQFLLEAFNKAVEDNLYTEDQFLDFVADYFKGQQGQPGDTDVFTASNLAVQSAVSVKACFSEDDYSLGAGIIYKLDKINGECYIITNFHVVSYYDTFLQDVVISDDIKVLLYGIMYFDEYETYDTYATEAIYLGSATEYDIAILKVTDGESYNSDAIFNGNAHACGVSERWDLALGTSVIAVGNPLGEGISVSEGIVSVVSEYLIMESLTNPSVDLQYRVLRTTASINSGNSGGGLFDRNGHLVGIVNARTFEHNDLPVDNIGYAIPLDIVIRAAEQIIDRQGDFNRKILGINIRTQNHRTETAADGEVISIEDVFISKFDNNNPYQTLDADNHTKLMINDQITSIKYKIPYTTAKFGPAGSSVERSITRWYQIPECLIDCYNATEVIFTVLRGDDTTQVTITLEL